MKYCLILLAILIVNQNLLVIAEPWINTDNIQLRSDIELLSDIGVIQVPITTYPLMWSGIIKDIDHSDIQNIAPQFKDAYWRVKKAGKTAILNRPKRQLHFTVGQSEQVFRAFGDSSRGKSELMASSTNMSKSFAWNLQVNRVYRPIDGDSYHYDGSYVAAVWGNWIASLGKLEQWWGASWDSANLLSNNARPPLVVSMTRNYSDKSELPFLEWLGSWSFKGFVGRLYDVRVVSNPYLSGASLSVKPLDSLEASFRVTAISSGDTNADPGSISTAISESKILTGFDFRWRVPNQLLGNDFPASVYFSVTDEGQKSNFSTLQFGFSSRFKLFQNDWRIFLESTDTAASSSSHFNTAYEDGIYRTGYRYNRRAIGSTYDNDSKVISFGLIGTLGKYQSISIKAQNLSINQREFYSPLDAGHSISSHPVKVNRLLTKWQIQFDKNNRCNLELDYSDNVVDGLARQDKGFSFSLGWQYYL